MINKKTGADSLFPLGRKQTILVSSILIFALALRLCWHHLSNTLSAETIILSTLTLPIFLIIYFALLKITKDSYSSLFALAIAAIMPLRFDSYLWTVSAIFFFLTLYAAVTVRKDTKNWRLCLLFPVIASLTHYSAILLAPIFIAYLILLALEHDTLRKEEVLFIALTSIISLLIVLSIGGLPEKSLMTGVGIVTLFALVGTRPIIFGVAGAYYGIKDNVSQSLIFASTAGVIFMLLFLKTISSAIGLPYLFISLAGLGGLFFQRFMKLIRISRLTRIYGLVRLGLFLFILITGLIHWI